jgi:hypothetical protein
METSREKHSEERYRAGGSATDEEKRKERPPPFHVHAEREVGSCPSPLAKKKVVKTIIKREIEVGIMGHPPPLLPLLPVAPDLAQNAKKKHYSAAPTFIENSTR